MSLRRITTSAWYRTAQTVGMAATLALAGWACAGAGDPARVASARCADLAAMRLVDFSIVSASQVADGDAVPHCRVQGLIDDEINFELLLPDAWNGRFMMGGGQGTMESQRYPDDFDGIVSGAPARDWAGIGVQFTQSQLLLYPNPSAPPVLDADVRTLLERTILERCDDIDGVTDGVMGDPRQCPFQPEDLPRCTGGGNGSDCATDAQIAAIRAIYDGPTVNGEHVYSGLPFGGEAALAGWGQWVVGAPNMLGPGFNNLHHAFGAEFFRYFVFDDPDWDLTKYDFSTWATDTRAAGELLNSTRTDLSAFETAGGKLILWNGWSDPALSALDLIDYYEGVQAEHGDAEDFVRLFLLPGVLHCAGGPGPDQVEWLDVIQAWVEDGSAPDQVLAARRTNGEVEMQRPVCAYPAVARYDGTGDAKREESFSCGR